MPQPTPRTPSMYEAAMGADFAALGAAVQRFHRLSGHHALKGWVETAAPRSVFAKLLALCLGTPLRATAGPIRFELQAQPEAETWQRFFPSQTMRSRLVRQGRDIVELLGAARLTFALRAADGRLVMHLRRMRFLGIPCPAWLAPRIVAEETGEGGRLQFHVEAAVPFVGLVTSYHGYLQLPEEASA